MHIPFCGFASRSRISGLNSKVTVSSFGNIFNLATTKNNLCLHFNSDVEALGAYYSTYRMMVRFEAVGSGSSFNVGDNVCTTTLASPEPAGATLDRVEPGDSTLK